MYTKVFPGSPPPMRGKAHKASMTPHRSGITPAYAGKSSEKVESTVIAAGSPPPMRGKGSTLAVVVLVGRITPAYAGKSVSVSCFFSCSRDHPRLCGEKHPLLPPPFHDVGSPPPMRGKDHQENAHRTAEGITPAYAGKSVRQSRTCGSGQDHPRLCGEKCVGML